MKLYIPNMFWQFSLLCFANLLFHFCLNFDSDFLTRLSWRIRRMGIWREDCLVMVDGNDFEMDKQGSHKFKKAGLHDKFAFCIKTGWLVRIHDPFSCGGWPDISIFCHGLKMCLMRRNAGMYKGKTPSLLYIEYIKVLKGIQ